MKFILKRRTIEASTSHNPHRPRGQVKYGPWVTVGKFDTVDAAEAAITNGLYDWGVFHRGRKVLQG